MKQRNPLGKFVFLGGLCYYSDVGEIFLVLLLEVFKMSETEMELNETLKKEHEALKKECEKLQNEVKHLRERNEELLKEIEREKQWNTFLERECHNLW